VFGCPERIRTLESRDAWQTLGLSAALGEVSEPVRGDEAPSAAASPKKSLFNEIRAPVRKPPLRSKAEIKDFISTGHLEKYPFRGACKSDSENLFEFDHRERVRWGNWVSLI
jgi:hypothetical protein